MSDIEINDARSAEKIKLLKKEIVLNQMKIEMKNINNTSPILKELNKENINWDSLPVVLF